MTNRIHLARVMLGGGGLLPRGTYAAGTSTAMISCPKCGTVGSLRDHEIGPDGRVELSVACPNLSCSFHAFIVLDDWQTADKRT